MLIHSESHGPLVFAVSKNLARRHCSDSAPPRLRTCAKLSGQDGSRQEKAAALLPGTYEANIPTQVQKHSYEQGDASLAFFEAMALSASRGHWRRYGSLRPQGFPFPRFSSKTSHRSEAGLMLPPLFPAGKRGSPAPRRERLECLRLYFRRGAANGFQNGPSSKAGPMARLSPNACSMSSGGRWLASSSRRVGPQDGRWAWFVQVAPDGSPFNGKSADVGQGGARGARAVCSGGRPRAPAGSGLAFLLACPALGQVVGEIEHRSRAGLLTFNLDDRFGSSSSP